MLRRMLIVTVMSLVSGVAADVYVITLAERAWLACAGASFVLPFLGFAYQHWTIEEKGSDRVMRRLLLVLAMAVGGTLALGITMIMFP